MSEIEITSTKPVIEERIYIGNVDYKATEEDLRDFFKDMNVYVSKQLLMVYWVNNGWSICPSVFAPLPMLDCHRHAKTRTNIQTHPN